MPAPDSSPNGEPAVDQSATPEKKKAAAEILVLSLLENRARHGYEIAKLIESRSEGVLDFRVASLYPLLSRLEERGWISGQWVEKAGERRRRFYALTDIGRRALAAEERRWQAFVRAVSLVTEPGRA